MSKIKIHIPLQEREYTYLEIYNNSEHKNGSDEVHEIG